MKNALSDELLLLFRGLKEVDSPSKLPDRSARILSIAEILGDAAGQLCAAEIGNATWQDNPIAIHFMLAVLADHPQPSAKQLLEKWLTAPQCDVAFLDKFDLVRALASVADGQTEELMVAALSAGEAIIPDEYGWIRAAIIEVLGKRGSARSTSLIRSFLNSDVGAVADAAEEALAVLKQK